MPTLADVRQQYPQYSDMSDQQLADALHNTFYGDMPRAEFDRRIGLSVQQTPTSTTEPAIDMADVAKSAGIGVVKGGIGIGGLSGDARELLASGASALAGLAGYEVDPSSISQSLRSGGNLASLMLSGPTSQDLRGKIEGVTGPLYEPRTTAGKYAQTVGEFVPAAAGGPGGLARRMVTQAVLPGLTSEAAGQAAEGTALEPYARVAGAFAAPLALAAGGRVITPLPASATRAEAVATLRGEGVDLTAGQATGSKPLQWFESALGDIPGSGRRAAATTERQAEQFTAAALRRAGEDAPRATPEVIDRALSRIGQQFDDLAARNHVVMDRQLDNQLRAIENEYRSMVGPSQRAPIVENVLGDIIDAAASNGNRLDGAAYQAMRSRLDKAARGARADPQLSEALFGIRNALDDAMGRSIQVRAMATGQSPRDWRLWQEARQQYRNMLVIEKAATGAGENTALGLISPSALRNATVQQGRRAYARGDGGFADLARAGEAVMKPLPNSGTAPRAYAQAIPAAIGGLFGGLIGNMPGAAAGAAAALAGPPLLGRLLMSNPVQGYLRNQLTVPLPPAEVAQLRRILLGTATVPQLPSLTTH